MKALIIYESRFGNGKKLCQQLKEILVNNGHDAETFSVIDTDPNDLPGSDFYVFSSPTRMFMFPPAMRAFLKKFKPSTQKAKYALMTTYLDPRVRALANMEKMLKAKNMQKITDSLAIKVMGTEGPMENGWEQKLEEFAAKILKAL